MIEIKQILGLMLLGNVPIEAKIKAIDALKEQYYEEKWQKDLHKYVADSVAKGVNPEMIGCAQYFRQNNFFDKKFGIADVSKLISDVDMSFINRIDQLVNVIAYNYALRSINESAMTVLRKMNEGNGNVDELRSYLEDGIKATELEVVSDESNDDILDRIVTKHYEAMDGKQQGIELGFTCLRKKVLIEPVDMVVIAARPSMGKTAFAVTLIKKLALEQGLRTKIFALEMSKDQMMRRITSQLAEVPSWKIKYGKCSTDEIKRISDLRNHKNWDKFEIIEGTQTADNVYYMASKWKMNDDCDVIIVDYLQKLNSSRSTKKYEVVTYSSNRMKELSQDFNIPTICLAQLSRASEQRGGDKRPMLSDLRDSGEIEQDASIIGFLHRPAYYGFIVDENGNNIENIGELIISKNREGDLGIFNFNINPDTIAWSDPEDETFVEYKQGSLNGISTEFESENEMPF